jgi:hypothetical protein
MQPVQPVRLQTPERASGGSPPLAGLARALLTSAPTTRLAERAPAGYITPTICHSEVHDGC